MAVFTDAAGREWEVSLTVGDLADVRTATGFDLSGALRSEEGLVDLLFGDPARLVSVLWVLCEPAAVGTDVSPREFAHRFDGPTLEAAGEALLQAVADFFPRSRVGRAVRENLRATLDRMDEAAVAAITSRSKPSVGS